GDDRPQGEDIADRRPARIRGDDRREEGPRLLDGTRPQRPGGPAAGVWGDGDEIIGQTASIPASPLKGPFKAKPSPPYSIPGHPAGLVETAFQAERNPHGL